MRTFEIRRWIERAIRSKRPQCSAVGQRLRRRPVPIFLGVGCALRGGTSTVLGATCNTGKGGGAEAPIPEKYCIRSRLAPAEVE